MKRRPLNLLRDAATERDERMARLDQIIESYRAQKRRIPVKAEPRPRPKPTRSR